MCIGEATSAKEWIDKREREDDDREIESEREQNSELIIEREREDDDRKRVNVERATRGRGEKATRANESERENW